MFNFFNTRLQNRLARRSAVRRGLIAAVGMLLGLLVAPMSMAGDCYLNGDKNNTLPNLNPSVFTFSVASGLSNVNVMGPVGSILGVITSGSGSTPTNNPRADCQTKFNVSMVGVGTPQVMDIKGNSFNPAYSSYQKTGASVYPTSINGIGIAFLYPANNNNWAPWQSTGTQSYATFIGSMGSYTLYFVKTGEITAGGSLTGQFGQWQVNSPVDGTVPYAILQFSGSVPITPQIPYCSVTTTSPTANLGSVPVNNFGGQGSTAGTPATVNISLSCSGGTAGSATKMYMTLTDATDPSNRTNLLSLTNSSTGSGVKVQLSLADNSIISYGPESSVANNPGQFFVRRVDYGTSTVNIPITAKYIATGDPLKAGTANAIATFTMSYQ